MKTNIKDKKKVYTYEGGKGRMFTPEQELRRSVVNCLLFENEFYEDGEAIFNRIFDTAQKVDKDKVAELAREARHEFGIRHAPLVLLLDLIRRGGNGVADVIADVISRADELGELFALYWRGGKKPLSNQMKKGLANTFHKFDEYQFAKYSGKNVKIKPRDVMFLTHPKPRTTEEEELFRRIADDKLRTPNTWEVRLSSGEDKKEVFEDLLRNNKLGVLALIRNLRNMEEVGVDPSLIVQALERAGKAKGILPFQWARAYENTQHYKKEIDQTFKENMKTAERFSGNTVILVDVSGSMFWESDRRYQYAATVAAAFNGNKRVFAFSDYVGEAKTYLNSLGLLNHLTNVVRPGGTQMWQAIRKVKDLTKDWKVDRVIVVTDEQAFWSNKKSGFGKHNYIVNVASYKVGVATDDTWTRVDGVSSNIFRWMTEYEKI